MRSSPTRDAAGCGLRADPVGTLTAEAQEEALLAMTLHAPGSIDTTVKALRRRVAGGNFTPRLLGALRRTPQYETREEHLIRKIAVWTQHLYPGSKSGVWMDQPPDFVLDALLTRCTRTLRVALH